jgi:hypothetical protein
MRYGHGITLYGHVEVGVVKLNARSRLAQHISGEASHTIRFEALLVEGLA